MAIGLAMPVNFLVRLNNAFKIEIPEGYEDKTGFHFGPEPEEEKPERPTT